MSPLSISVIVVGSIAAYIFVAGVVWQLIQDWDEPAAVFGTAFWPCILPAIVIFWLGRLLAVTLPQKTIRIAAGVRDRTGKSKTGIPAARVVK